MFDAAIHYHIAIPNPASHATEVCMTLNPGGRPAVDLKLPVWTPGSYLVREYARHLHTFAATDDQGNVLSWRKVAKNHWQVMTAGVATLTVRYQLLAPELSVRTNHVDASHAFFTGAALFLYAVGAEDQPLQVTVVPPSADWQVTTPLARLAGEGWQFWAADYDTLVDSPIEVGIHERYEFEVQGRAHTLAVWGQGNLNPQRAVADIRRIIEVEAKLFGGLPYERYLFLLHLSSQGNGGLEHRDSCTLNYPRFGFQAPERYNRFLNLVAHEFFHLWNVKRLRPAELAHFDYDQENYTPSLWFSEGTTSYYDLLIPLRAGLYDVAWFLKELGEMVTRLWATPGRQVQSLSEASFDAWIKYYRRDAYSLNIQISYYLKGALVTLMLDLLIRQQHNQQRSFDDVLRHLWAEFGRPERGFTAAELRATVEAIAETDLADFWRDYIDGTVELPLAEALAPYGLRIVAEGQLDTPYLGLITKMERGQHLIQAVPFDSPAHRAGLDPGDELLALDGLRVTADDLGVRLRDYAPGATVTLTVFRQDRLQTHTVLLGPPTAGRWAVVPVDAPTEAQKQACMAWLGAFPA